MKQAKDRIIFPLDVPSAADAEKYTRMLSDEVGLFKIGLELFIQEGPEMVRRIQQESEAEIFLDLKLHDIPATVNRAMSRVADLGVRFVTVHCGENPRMLEAAVEGGKGKVGVLGVTVLTSVSAQDIRNAGFNEDLAGDLNRLVMKRAETAQAAGCAGVICSGMEASGIKSRFGKDFLAVTPGIRPLDPNAGADDQQRVVTPAKAIKNGADFLVIGRPIRDADDPKKAARAIAAEIDAALG